MSQYLEQAETTYRRLKTKIDCLCLGLNKPDGTPLEYVYIHPLTTGHHVMMDKKFGSDDEGAFEAACLDFFFLTALDDSGRRVWDQKDREELPYRIPKTRINKLIPAILEGMRNDIDDFIEEEKENFDDAELPVSAIPSLKG